MIRIILGVVAGFFAWAILWFGGERILSAIWPAFGVHQTAFQDALENGGQFTAESPMLIAHIVLGSIVSVVAGLFAAMVAGENKRAPFIVGILLLAMGVMKLTMSWAYVPIWYHIIFTGMLLPMAIIGGRLKSTPN